MTQEIVSVERVIPAPPEKIFELVASPAGQARIDGSGTVRKARSADQRLRLGDRFSMDMRIVVPYASANEVIEFEENRRIAWRQVMGHQVWRYELEPVEGGTLVREQFDWSHYRGKVFIKLLNVAEKNRKGMEATLARIEELVTTS